MIPPLVEEAPLYRAVITLRRPAKKVEALNQATVLQWEERRIRALVNAIHEVVLIHY